MDSARRTFRRLSFGEHRFTYAQFQQIVLTAVPRGLIMTLPPAVYGRSSYSQCLPMLGALSF